MKKLYYKHKLKNLLIVNNVVTMHNFAFDKNFSYPSESHDFWEFQYALNNGYNLTLDNKEYKINENDIVFLKPNSNHSINANGKDAPKIIIVSFNCKSEAMHYFEDKIVSVPLDMVDLLISLINIGKKTFDIENSTPDTTKMQILQNATLGGEQLIKNYIELFLISLLKHLNEKDYEQVKFLQENEYKSHITDLVIKELKNNVNKKLSVDEICINLNYSKSYLFREFKKHTGVTIMAYHLKLKIKEAQKLLTQTNYTITEISNTLSFDTPNYFSKSFKKVTGITPNTYRKLNKSK